MLKTDRDLFHQDQPRNLQTDDDDFLGDYNGDDNHYFDYFGLNGDANG